ncbi:hypothetical protein BDV29DRAFT_77731 [Aspergillus leporis]|uniref:Uncharacterized protein n=1 Tax=Aspergillus leporis TaxID=41062 RepID=A0A5N5X9I6_9EURO|nr:hypothetical protein BDV29DRAFT_77731 [Aspergillus leporis]
MKSPLSFPPDETNSKCSFTTSPPISSADPIVLAFPWLPLQLFCSLVQQPFFFFLYYFFLNINLDL